jgi:hypothetical protein
MPPHLKCSQSIVDCFSECSKQLVFNMLSQEVEKQIAKADETLVYSDDD